MRETICPMEFYALRKISSALTLSWRRVSRREMMSASLIPSSEAFVADHSMMLRIVRTASASSLPDCTALDMKFTSAFTTPFALQ